MTSPGDERRSFSHNVAASLAANALWAIAIAIFVALGTDISTATVLLAAGTIVTWLLFWFAPSIAKAVRRVPHRSSEARSKYRSSSSRANEKRHRRVASDGKLPNFLPSRFDHARPGPIRWKCELGDNICGRPQFLDGLLWIAVKTGAVIAIDVSSGQPTWRYTFDGGGTPTSISVTMEGVFVKSNRGTFTALDGINRRVLWEVELSPGSSSEVKAIHGDRIVLHDNGQLVGLDLSDGSARWRSPKESYMGVSALNDLLYVASTNDYATALNLIDGSVQWQNHMRGLISRPPLIVDSAVCFKASGTFAAYDRFSGRKIWNYSSPLGDADATAANGLLFVKARAADRSFVEAIDLSTGAKRWSAGAGSACVGPDGTVFVADSGGAFALDAATGEQKWKHEIKTEFRRAPVDAPVVRGDLVFVVFRYGYNMSHLNPDRQLHVLDAATGDCLWRYTLGWHGSSLIPWVSGRLLYDVSFGDIRCMNAATGGVQWRTGAFESDLTPENSYHWPPVASSDSVFICSEAGKVFAFENGDPLPLHVLEEVSSRAWTL